MPAEGRKLVQDALAAGFSPDEVDAWTQQTTQDMQAAGFSRDEVLGYYGLGQNDVPGLKSLMEQAVTEAAGEEGQTQDVSFADALSAGFDLSASGLIAAGKTPETDIPVENLSLFDRLAFKSGALAGDIPFMLAGGAAGAGVGLSFNVASPIAVPALGFAGAFAVPAMVRQSLMDAYERDEGTSFRSFWADFSRVAIEGFKGAAVGGATGATGGAVTAAGAPLAAAVGGEIVTMTTLGAAMEGRVPEPEEFLDAAILIGGLRGSRAAVRSTTTKLRDVYSNTGVRPRDVARDALNDPSIAEDMLSRNIRNPRAYGGDERPPIPTALQERITTRAKEVALKTENTAESRILGRLSIGEKVKKPRKTLDDYYTDYLDRLHPVSKTQNEMVKAIQAKDPNFNLSMVEDAYTRARLHVGVAGKATHFLEYSPFKFKTLERVGRPLKEILEPVKDDMNRMRVYLAARRTIEVQKQGKKTGISMQDAREVVSRNTDLAPIAQELSNYQRHILEYLRDSGVVSAKDFKAMQDLNANYVPMYRVLDKGPVSGLSSTPFARNPVRKMMGSDLQIVDPLESIIKNTYLFISMAERNAIGEAFVRLAERAPNGSQYAVPLKAKSRAIRLQPGELTRILKKLGEDKTLTAAEEAILNESPIFRPAAVRPEKGVAAIFRDGNRELWRIDDKVWDAFASGDSVTSNALVRLFAIPARMLRAGAILSPEFIARNPVRDQLSAFLFTSATHPGSTLANTFAGVFHLARKDALYQEWLRSGGPQATLISLDRNYLQGQARAVLGKEGANLFETGRNIAKAPIEILRTISEASEQATRIGEFRRQMKGKPSTAENIQRAGFASREVTLDFGRIGARTTAANQLIAFFNASLQGTDKMVREFKSRPVEMGVKVGASIVLPSIILQVLNRQEPDWDEVQQWQKDLFWLIPTGEAGTESRTWTRVPKPFEIGIIFGTGTERMVDFILDKDPAAFDEFISGMVRGGTPGVVPQSLIPVIETFANRSIFLDRPIIPANREKVLPAYQYRPYTTELLKQLGKSIAMIPGMKQSDMASPVVLENALRGWTGGLGTHILNLADKALRETGALPPRNDPTETLADTPFVKAFIVRFPTAGAQSIQTFFDRYFKRQRTIETIKVLAREGEPEAALELLRASGGEVMFDLTQVRESLGRINRVQRLIWVNKDMDPDYKRQILDRLIFQQIEIAKMGNKMLDRIEERFE